MVYYCDVQPRYREDTQVSNIRYDGDRLKVNANLNTTNAVCFVGGCIIGAALTYYLLKSINNTPNS